MTDILLTPLTHIGCLRSLSVYKKEDVKSAYLKCWKKSHTDSKFKSEDNGSTFMESFGYAFKNLVENVQPLINPDSFKDPVENLDWQFIWNFIYGLETRILADTIESNVLQKYIKIMKRVQNGSQGEKFPVGYFEAIKSYLDDVKRKEQQSIIEYSRESEDNQEKMDKWASESSCESEVQQEEVFPEVEDSNEVVFINLDDEIEGNQVEEEKCANESSFECEGNQEEAFLEVEDTNEVVSINLDESLNVEEIELSNEDANSQNKEDNLNDNLKRKKMFKLLKTKKKKSNDSFDENLENVIDVDNEKVQNECQEDNLIPIKNECETAAIKVDVFNERNNSEDEKQKDEQQKRVNISWKKVRQTAQDKGKCRTVLKVDDYTLHDGCFLIVNESVKFSEITHTRNWGRGLKLNWKCSRSALGYHCQGSKVCDNDDCEYLRNAKYCKAIETKRNVYFWNKLNGEESCQYCEGTRISEIHCDARLLIVTTKAGKREIYQTGPHSCFKKKLNSKLPEEFKEKLQTNELTPRATEDLEIMNMIKGGKSKDEIVSEASKFISAGKSGSIRKYNQVTKNLGSKEEQIIEAQKRFSIIDPLIIEHVIFGSKDPKVFGTSEEMLELALSLDEDVSENSLEYVHQDGVHSFLRDGKMLAIYAIHPLLNSIVRLAWVFCATENAENLSFLWINFNRVFSERKKKILKENNKVRDDLKFKPYGIMSDCHGANSNGLIMAGYDPEWVKKVLRNCISHFKMRVEQREKDVVKSHGAKKAKEFQCLSWKWQRSVTEEGAQINFQEWKSLCDDIGQGNFCRWWNGQRMFVVQAFRGVYTPKSNLSECYQSGLSKGLSQVQALNNQGLASFRIGIRLSALSQGSKNVMGQTPTKTEKRLANERKDAMFASQVSDELNNIILLGDTDGSCSNNNQDIPTEDQKCGPSSGGNMWGRKPNHRTKLNQNAEKSLKLVKEYMWTVLDIQEKKIFKLRRGNMVVNVNISNYPSCTCSFWRKMNESSDQTCADIMYVLKELFQVSIEDSRIFQVMFRNEELKLLRSQYQPPKASTPEWGKMSDSELKALFNSVSTKEPVWKLGRTKGITTAKCRGCSRVLGHSEVVAFAEGLALNKNTMKPIPNRFNFCLNSKCPKKLPYTNLSEPGTFKLDHQDGQPVLTNEEIEKALDVISSIDFDD